MGEVNWAVLTQAERDAYAAESEQRPGESANDHQIRAQALRARFEAVIRSRTETVTE